MKRSVPFIIGIAEIQRGLSHILRQLDRTAEEGFVVSHNEPKAVLMGLKRYEELRSLEEAKWKEEEEVLALVKEGDREYEEGKTRTAKSIRTLL